ncbi:MAG: hypothetical protein R2753_16915 [Chitinophagales bacterium]
MGLLLLMLMCFIFCIVQLVQDDGIGALKDFSFWLIVVSFAAMVTFIAGGVNF